MAIMGDVYMKDGQSIRDFWEERSSMGEIAGSNDFLMKKLEVKKIMEYMRDGIDVLDVGCGNGITCMEIASKFKLNICGVDFSEGMIKEAYKNIENADFIGDIRFYVSDVASIEDSPKYDIIYTERCLINLPSWEEQKDAMYKIFSLLKKDGLFLMCENSSEGLDEINLFRSSLGLDEIKKPWHNRYFFDSEIDSVDCPGVKLEFIENFSSTYYFLSRVINAWMAKEDGKSPSYDAPINKLALDLPPLGLKGQVRLWGWRRL